MTVPLSRSARILPKTVWLAFFCGILLFAALPVARAQTSSTNPQAPPTPQADTSQNAPKPGAKASNDEIVSHDSPATFQVRVNLVLVRAVVRDRQSGHEFEEGRFSTRG